MKRTLPYFSALLLAATVSGQQILISEDFEAFDPGDPLAQTAGLPWNTWSNAPGGTEDTPCTNAQAHGGNMSASFTSTSANGGPTDIMLQLGNRTSGQYLLGWWMYIPAGKGGYYNIQKSITAGQAWSIDVIFRSSGAIELSPNAIAGATTTYPQGEWFLVGMSIDLNSSAGVVTINGNVVANWITTTAVGAGGVGLNQIGGVNFFAYSGGDQSEYYIDDVSFIDITGVGVPEMSAIDASTFPNPTEGAFVVDATNLSSAATMTVVDLTGRQVVAPRALLRRGSVSRAEVDLSGHPSGLYFVRIQDGGQELVRRVTKH
ncbi:MAG: T9SS type A sorting domain-containing protein [Flavobacteriales bacterium]